MDIINEIREEMHAAQRPPSGRDLTVLALLFTGIACVVGAYYLVWRGVFAGWYWIGAGILLGALRLIPAAFRIVYRVWIGFSVIIGYFVSRIILLLVFLIVMVPTGLLMRALGKDPMERKLQPETHSYWMKRAPDEDQSVERYEKQF
jgi:hypothetical protein